MLQGWHSAVMEFWRRTPFSSQSHSATWSVSQSLSSSVHAVPRIELSPEHCFRHMADDAAETIWMATPTIYLRRPSRPTNDRFAKTK